MLGKINHVYTPDTTKDDVIPSCNGHAHKHTHDLNDVTIAKTINNIEHGGHLDEQKQCEKRYRLNFYNNATNNKCCFFLTALCGLIAFSIATACIVFGVISLGECELNDTIPKLLIVNGVFLLLPLLSRFLILSLATCYEGEHIVRKRTYKACHNFCYCYVLFTCLHFVMFIVTSVFVFKEWRNYDNEQREYSCHEKSYLFGFYTLIVCCAVYGFLLVANFIRCCCTMFYRDDDDEKT